MERNITNVKKPFLFWCIVFSLATVASSILQLLNNQPSDTNIHILNRGVIVLIGTIIYEVMSKIRTKNVLVSTLLIYVISMGMVYLYVWLFGFIEPLHPNAYRDITLNFTPLFIIISVIVHNRSKKNEGAKK